jgi:chitin synthase
MSLKKVKKNKNIGFVIPCYTEDKQKILITLESISKSIRLCVDKYHIEPIIFIIVDGKNKGKYNEYPTYQYLNELLNIKKENTLTMSYVSWKREQTNVDISFGMYDEKYKFMLFVKEKNQTKKDSLILIRKIIKYLNELKIEENKNLENDDIQIVELSPGYDIKNKLIIPNETFNNKMVHLIKKEFNINSIDLLFGTDVGTLIEPFTVIQLVESVCKNDNVMGVSGLVRVNSFEQRTKYKWLVLYQAFEYIIQQAITRAGQSIFRHVTCLPGCIQIFKMHDNCIGDILNKFEELPSDNMLSKIRAYLGEDRRYTCLIQYAHPESRMKLNANANVYTDVPDTWSVFLSQRRRWFLSSNANNITDVFSSSLPLIVRFIAFAQLWSTLFIFTNTVCFVRAIIFLCQIESVSACMLLIGVYIFLTGYKIIIAFLYSESLGEFAYFLLSIMIFFIISQPINLIIFIWALLTMDDYSWGKTQNIDNQLNNHLEKQLETTEQINNKKIDQQLLKKEIDPLLNNEQSSISCEYRKRKSLQTITICKNDFLNEIDEQKYSSTSISDSFSEESELENIGSMQNDDTVSDDSLIKFEIHMK